MKKTLLTFVLLLAGTALFAQDRIVKRNADEIEALVLKVGEREIEYRRADNPDGPIYVIPTDEVFFIRYRNGTKDIFEPQPSPQEEAAPSAANDRPQHFRLEPKPLDGDTPTPHLTIGYRRPHYAGELSAAFGLGVGLVSQYLPTNRIYIETIHGIRFNPWLSAGLGLGFAYFYNLSYSVYLTENLGAEYDGLGMLPFFLDLKGFYPVHRKADLYLALDLGAATAVSGGISGTEFYAAVGPGIRFGSAKGSPRGDFGIRFQHMGEGTNAILFRVGVNF